MEMFILSYVNEQHAYPRLCPREKGEGGKGGRERGEGWKWVEKGPGCNTETPKLTKRKSYSFPPHHLNWTPSFHRAPHWWTPPPTGKPPPSLGTHCPPWAPCWFRNLSLLNSPLVITFPLPLALVTLSERPHSGPVTPGWAQRGGSCGFWPSYPSQDLPGVLTP